MCGNESIQSVQWLNVVVSQSLLQAAADLELIENFIIGRDVAGKWILRTCCFAHVSLFSSSCRCSSSILISVERAS